jgi:phosphatidylserine decarboxylase
LKFPFARGSQATLVIATLILASGVWAHHHLPPALDKLLLALIAPLWLLVLYFFRDPERAIPAGEDLILSPADGKIVEICEVHESQFIQGRALRISIFMSITDVHVNRSPVAGRVALVRHIPGKFLQAFRPEASEVNENMLMGLHTHHGPVLVKQIAGILARRCVNYAAVGQQLQAGQRFGLIRFSSRVDLFLPRNVQPVVQLGQHVSAGRSVLAQWNSKENTA